MNEPIISSDYKGWLIELKSKIKQSQIKAALSVNSELIRLYWELGTQIVEKQRKTSWGAGFIDQLSKDLKDEFPDITGFSKRNIELIKQWYLFYRGSFVIAKQAVSYLQNADIEKVISSFEVNDRTTFTIKLFNIPWGHHILIIQKIKDINEASYYINETLINNWSRSILEYQIETDLYNRQGKAITNFSTTLPSIDSDLANALLKDPYNFEFLTLSTQIKEQELEHKLVQHITQFLLELGKGFAYMGRQYLIVVGGKEFRTDLLFYHTKLKCYVVIELKVTEFEPEFLGKLNFYLTAINTLIKADDDKPTIGILLCKNKNDIVVDFTLKDINKPMGVSRFTYKELPAEIKNALPSIELLTKHLNQ
jgi:predicted nuclease of restriction endonuclease-like (RecB) superfamily